MCSKDKLDTSHMAFGLIWFGFAKIGSDYTYLWSLLFLWHLIYQNTPHQCTNSFIQFHLNGLLGCSPFFLVFAMTNNSRKISLFVWTRGRKSRGHTPCSWYFLKKYWGSRVYAYLFLITIVRLFSPKKIVCDKLYRKWVKASRSFQLVLSNFGEFLILSQPKKWK